MLKDPLCNRKDEVRHWDALDLKDISNYYNLVKKINPSKATWGNNLIHTRETWVSIGKLKLV
jgi:hypothetical protein